MDTQTFRRHAHELVDWMADYLEAVEQYPVKSPVQPGDILGQLPAHPPEAGESFDAILADFHRIIVPGMTHWQSPNFYAYFPANTSPPSILAEMLTATMGAQCMVWDTSPAAAELEQRVMEWLREICGLPESFHGVIQDTASTATLCAILSARERASGFAVNDRGFSAVDKPFSVYCSSETHSSVEKAVKIAGLGRQSLRKIAVDRQGAMRPDALVEAIEADLAQGCQPLCVVAAIGTTGSTAIDPLRALGEICTRYGIWLHVDAAYAGSALVLPELRWMIDGIEAADSYVFNPHKWLFTNFDCSAYYVKDPETLVRTFEILPEYLKTQHDSVVNNYRDWGIQLGRRFRALKLWFVLRCYGVTGLQQKIAEHLRLAQDFAQRLQQQPGFELLAPVPLNLVCFRYCPDPTQPLETINALNAQLLARINATGQAYLTHTKLNGQYALRVCIAQTTVAQRHVDALLALIQTQVQQLSLPAPAAP